MDAEARATRVLLVDDHQLLTDSLARMLAAEDDIEGVVSAAWGAAARLGARQPVVGVVLD